MSKNTIIEIRNMWAGYENEAVLENINFTNSMIGNHVTINGQGKELSIGDYSTLK